MHVCVWTCSSFIIWTPTYVIIKPYIKIISYIFIMKSIAIILFRACERVDTLLILLFYALFLFNSPFGLHNLANTPFPSTWRPRVVNSVLPFILLLSLWEEAYHTVHGNRLQKLHVPGCWWWEYTLTQNHFPWTLMGCLSIIVMCDAWAA